MTASQCSNARARRVHHDSSIARLAAQTHLMYMRDAHPSEARQVALQCVLATLAPPLPEEGERKQEGAAAGTAAAGRVQRLVVQGPRGAQSLRQTLMVHSALHLLNQAAAGAQEDSQHAILKGIKGGRGLPVYTGPSSSCA